MALRVYNGSGFDKILGSPSIITSGVNTTTSYISGSAITAPNTSDKLTGCLIFVNSVPSSGDLEIDVTESGVSKASGILSNADIQLGFNYVRFSTPYQFTTLAANAYVPRVRNLSANTGQLARESSTTNILLMLTCDGAGALGATDDTFFCGLHNSGMTPQTITLTGLLNSWGSGTDRNFSSTISRSLGAATVVGNGATLKFDTTADCKLKQYGAILVTKGGVFDMRPGASSVSTLEFDNQVADGDFGLITASGGFGGQILTAGKTVNVANKFVSGVGTAANPVTTLAAHGLSVGDELVFGGASDYLKDEVRYVKSIPGANQLVLSTTVGGAEAALTQTHAVGSHIGNMTRNSIIKNTNTSRGFWILHNTTTSDISDFSYTRMEYSNCLSGKALQLSSQGHATNIDGIVVYHNSAQGRTSIQWGGAIEQTSSEILLYNTRGTNYSAQSGLALAGATNKTIDGLYHFADPSSTTNCAAVSISNTTTSCIVKNAHSYGANAVNGNGYAFGIYGSGNLLENCSANAARRQAVVLDAGTLNIFRNCRFGDIANNTIDISVSSGVLAQALFEDCTCGSTTRISGYTTALPGSDISFQNLDGNSDKHRWYTDKGSFASAGSGLPDTTVRTAGSLSLAIKPENNSQGATWEFLVPAVPSSQCGIFGYGYRNATFSAGTFKVELFLPGSSVADASFTFSTSTGSWLPFNISAYYSGTKTRFAKVKITAISSTAGAYAFLDDLYDAGTANKVAGLDLWHEGKPSKIMVAADYSAIPAQVWGYSDQTTNPDTMGQRQVDASSSAQVSNLDSDVTSLAEQLELPILLIKDKLS